MDTFYYIWLYNMSTKKVLTAYPVHPYEEVGYFLPGSGPDEAFSVILKCVNNVAHLRAFLCWR